MLVRAASEPGTPIKPNEDWYYASPQLVVVLDGATVRTGTGCHHGVPWYTQHLGDALVANARAPQTSLVDALAQAIRHVAGLHPDCDLTHPGTPSAGTGILRVAGDVLEHLVLGDVTVLIETAAALTVIVDNRVSQTGEPDRGIAMRLPLDHPDRPAAMLRMKRGELAARNRDGGYWIAAADPTAVRHALTGRTPIAEVRRAAVLTDGAARAVDLFQLLDWHEALNVLTDADPHQFVQRVRTAEARDPQAVQWPRMKDRDDATVVVLNHEAIA